MLEGEAQSEGFKWGLVGAGAGLVVGAGVAGAIGYYALRRQAEVGGWTIPTQEEVAQLAANMKENANQFVGSEGGGNDDPSASADPKTGHLDGWPQHPGPHRDKRILDAVTAGKHDSVHWRYINSQVGQLEALIPVPTDALRIEGVRVTPSARAAAQLVPLLGGGVQMTPYVSWLAWKQAEFQIKFKPQLWFADGTMALTHRMVEYSAIVDQQILKAVGRAPEPVELVWGPWKSWTLIKRIFSNGKNNEGIPYSQTGANFGGFFSSKKVAQKPGTWHNLAHADYSQPHHQIGAVTHVREAGSSWLERSTAEVITDPKWGPLLCGPEGKIFMPGVAGEGHLPAAFHPGVLVA